jgi:hypothetical protein
MNSKRKAIGRLFDYSREFFKLNRKYNLKLFIAMDVKSSRSGLTEQRDSEKKSRKYLI